MAIALAGCGGSGHSSSGSSAAAATASTASSTAAAGSTGGPPPAFAWLQPQPPPADWKLVRIPVGAVFAYPPSWKQVKGDPGTATAALQTPSGRYLGYLNVTPRQGNETLANWASFRVHHNLEEGDRKVTRLADAAGLRFLDGHGNCVKDLYLSGTGAPYIEIACLVAGAKANTVIVGAAPPSSWPHVSGTIERAISGFRT